MLEETCTPTYYKIESPGNAEEVVKCVGSCDLWRKNATNGLSECLSKCPDGWVKNGNESVRVCPETMLPDVNNKCVSRSTCECVSAGRCLGARNSTTCPLANKNHEKATYCERFSEDGACVDACEKGLENRFECVSKTSTKAYLSPLDPSTGLRLAADNCELF